MSSVLSANTDRPPVDATFGRQIEGGLHEGSSRLDAGDSFVEYGGEGTLSAGEDSSSLTDGSSVMGTVAERANRLSSLHAFLYSFFMSSTFSLHSSASSVHPRDEMKKRQDETERKVPSSWIPVIIQMVMVFIWALSSMQWLLLSIFPASLPSESLRSTWRAFWVGISWSSMSSAPQTSASSSDVSSDITRFWIISAACSVLYSLMVFFAYLEYSRKKDSFDSSSEKNIVLTLIQASFQSIRKYTTSFVTNKLFCATFVHVLFVPLIANLVRPLICDFSSGTLAGSNDSCASSRNLVLGSVGVVLSVIVSMWTLIGVRLLHTWESELDIFSSLSGSAFFFRAQLCKITLLLSMLLQQRNGDLRLLAPILLFLGNGWILLRSIHFMLKSFPSRQMWVSSFLVGVFGLSIGALFLGLIVIAASGGVVFFASGFLIPLLSFVVCFFLFRRKYQEFLERFRQSLRQMRVEQDGEFEFSSLEFADNLTRLRFAHFFLWNYEEDCEVDLFELENVLLELAEISFPSSPRLSLSRMRFLLQKEEMSRLVFARLRDLLETHPLSEAERFYAYVIGELLAETDESRHIQLQLSILRRKISRCRVTIRKFWKSLTPDNVNVESLPGLLEAIQSRERDCDVTFKSSLARFPSYHPLIRLFSEYVRTVKLDITQANTLIAEAERIEDFSLQDEHSFVGKSSTLPNMFEAASVNPSQSARVAPSEKFRELRSILLGTKIDPDTMSNTRSISYVPNSSGDLLDDVPSSNYLLTSSQDVRYHSLHNGSFLSFPGNQDIPTVNPSMIIESEMMISVPGEANKLTPYDHDQDVGSDSRSMTTTEYDLYAQEQHRASLAAARELRESIVFGNTARISSASTFLGFTFLTILLLSIVSISLSFVWMMQFVHLRSDRTIVWSRLGECRRTVANVENVLFYLFEKTSFDRVDLVPIQTLQSWLQRNASHMTPSCVVLFDESPLFHPQTSASINEFKYSAGTPTDLPTQFLSRSTLYSIVRRIQELALDVSRLSISLGTTRLEMSPVFLQTVQNVRHVVIPSLMRSAEVLTQKEEAEFSASVRSVLLSCAILGGTLLCSILAIGFFSVRNLSEHQRNALNLFLAIPRTATHKLLRLYSGARQHRINFGSGDTMSFGTAAPDNTTLSGVTGGEEHLSAASNRGSLCIFTENRGIAVVFMYCLIVFLCTGGFCLWSGSQISLFLLSSCFFPVFRLFSSSRVVCLDWWSFCRCWMSYSSFINQAYVFQSEQKRFASSHSLVSDLFLAVSFAEERSTMSGSSATTNRFEALRRMMISEASFDNLISSHMTSLLDAHDALSGCSRTYCTSFPDRPARISSQSLLLSSASSCSSADGNCISNLGTLQKFIETSSAFEAWNLNRTLGVHPTLPVSLARTRLLRDASYTLDLLPSLQTFFSDMSKIFLEYFESLYESSRTFLVIIFCAALFLSLSLAIGFSFPLYRSYRRITQQIYKTFGYLPEEVVKNSPLLYSFLVRGESISAEDLEKTLMEGEEKLRIAMDSSEDGVIMTDSKGIITMCNNAISLLSGYTKSELLGANIKILVPPGVRERHDDLIRDHVQTGKSRLVWRTIRTKLYTRNDEKNIPVTVTVSEGKVRGNHFFVAFIHSLAEILERESAIKKQEQMLARVLQGWKDGIIVTDQYMTIRAVNDELLRMYGFTKEELLGKNVKILVPSEHRGRHDDYIAHYKEVGYSPLIANGRELVAERKDGTTFPAFVSVIDGDDGEHRFFAAHLRDLSLDKEEIQETKDGVLRQESVFSYLQEPVLITDERANITMANHASLSLFGYPDTESLISSLINVRELIADRAARRSHDTFVKEYLRTGQSRNALQKGVSTAVICKDGSTIPVVVRVREGRFREKRFFAVFIRDLSKEEEKRFSLRKAIQSNISLLQCQYPLHIRNQLLSAATEPIASSIRVVQSEDIILDYPPFLHRNVAVFASDVVNFTRFSSQADPQTMIRIMSEFFDTFDVIGSKYGVQRLKLIGDAYIAVCGFEDQYMRSDGSSDSSNSESFDENKLVFCYVKMVQFAAEVLLSLPDINSRLNLDTKLNMRIGIGSGELCSALVGDVSRSFEVYGDALNEAEELESSGVPSKIHISSAAKARLELFAPWLVSRFENVPYDPHTFMICSDEVSLSSFSTEAGGHAFKEKRQSISSGNLAHHSSSMRLSDLMTKEEEENVHQHVKDVEFSPGSSSQVFGDSNSL